MILYILTVLLRIVWLRIKSPLFLYLMNKMSWFLTYKHGSFRTANLFQFYKHIIRHSKGVKIINHAKFTVENMSRTMFVTARPDPTYYLSPIDKR